MTESAGLLRYHHLKVDFYKISAYFIFCAFLGWIYETLVVWITFGFFQAKGYLFVGSPISSYLPFLKGIPILQDIPLVWGLPIIEMYGFGGLLLLLCFNKWAGKPLHLFFIGAIVMSIYELLSSYFCEFMLHRIFWDYSNHFMNFQGRISLLSAATWGVLSVVVVRFKPAIDQLYHKLEAKKHFKITMIILIIYTLICAVIAKLT